MAEASCWRGDATSEHRLITRMVVQEDTAWSRHGGKGQNFFDSLQTTTIKPDTVRRAEVLTLNLGLLQAKQPKTQKLQLSSSATAGHKAVLQA